MFGMFTASMFGTCAYLAIVNLTQVEKLGSRTKAYQLAVLKPSPKELQHLSPQEAPEVPYTEITYPLENGLDGLPQPWCVPNLNTQAGLLTAPETSQLGQGILDQPRITPIVDSLGNPSMPEQTTSEGVSLPLTPEIYPPPGTTDLPSAPSTQPISSSGMQQDTNQDRTRVQKVAISSRDSMASRTFAILGMETGENPWDLDSWLLNVETVMGSSVVDFLLPIKRSPCCNHDDSESYYDIGPAVDRLKAKYRLVNEDDMRVRVEARRSKRSTRTASTLP